MLTGIVLGPSLFGALFPTVQAGLFPEHAAVVLGGTTATISHPSMQVLYALSQLGPGPVHVLRRPRPPISSVVRQRWRTVALVSFAGIAAPFAIRGAVRQCPTSKRIARFFAPRRRLKWQAALFARRRPFPSPRFRCSPASSGGERASSGTRSRNDGAGGRGPRTTLVALGHPRGVARHLRATPATARPRARLGRPCFFTRDATDRPVPPWRPLVRGEPTAVRRLGVPSQCD